MSKVQKIDLAAEVLAGGELPAENAKALLKEFGAPFENAGKLLATYKDIVVKDEQDTAGMAKARETRLELRKERILIEKQHKALKADVLVKGRAIDYVKNTALAEIEPAEAYLKEQEEFKERAEQARRDERITRRTQALLQYIDDVSIYNFGDMDDKMFAMLLTQVEDAFELKRLEAERLEREQAEADAIAKKEQEAKEKADRIARLKAEAEAATLRLEQEAFRKKAEADRIAHENELRKARDEQARKDAEAAATLKAEREAREQLEREAQAAKQLEDERIAAEQEAARELAEAVKKAASAPEREQFLNWVLELGESDGIKYSTDKGERLAERIGDHFAKTLEMYRNLIEKEL